MSGITDKPTLSIDDDLFNVKLYVDGLGSFIRECNTPMTIAIQGDWGSGKTSIMNMVNQTIPKEVKRIWFNTWQYSQFNMGDDLPIALMSSLIEKLEKQSTESSIKLGLQKSVRRIQKNIKPSIVALAGIAGGERIASLTEDVLNDQDATIADVVENLKDQFQDFIDHICSSSKSDRIVIFIDDLDRLQPEKAVELLEVLKIFLDCERCVFVLAIDYEVVSQGIRKKFGDSIGIAKGRSFFDKIIQVPFKMPVAQYNIENFVLESLKDLKIQLPQESTAKQAELSDYVELIFNSIGRNPRSIKRLFNAFTLLDKMPLKSEINQMRQKKLLFSILCMQLSFEDCYNYIVSENEMLDADFFMAFKNFAAEPDEDGEPNEQYAKMKQSIKITDEEWTIFANFMSAFDNVLNKDGIITQNDMDEFCSVLKFSTITAAGNTISRAKKGSRGVRYDVAYNNQTEYHTIAENVEKTNSPNGWNGAKFEECQVNGNRNQGTRLAVLMDFIMQELFSFNSNRMNEVVKNPEQFKLTSLFPSSPHVPHTIPGTEINFETYSSNNEKIRLLRLLCEALELPLDKISFSVKLAKRV